MPTDANHIIWIQLSNYNMLQIPGQILPSNADCGYNRTGATIYLAAMVEAGDLYQIAQYTANSNNDALSTVQGISLTILSPTTHLAYVPNNCITAFKIN